MDSNKILMWLLGIIAAGLGTLIVGGFSWYNTWVADEATEDAVMFDTPTQKVETLDHIKAINTVDMRIKIERDEDFQKLLLKKLDKFEKQQKTTDSIARLGVRLIYEVEQKH